MSSRNILVINSGSSSIKFALVNEHSEQFLVQGLAGDGSGCYWNGAGR